MKKSFRDLFIWQRAVELAVFILDLTEAFPPRQRWVLVTQMQRSAISVSSNIAEGRGRLSQREFRQFLAMARGSLYELGTQVEIAHRAGLIEDDSLREIHIMAAQISTGISHLMTTIKT